MTITHRNNLVLLIIAVLAVTFVFLTIAPYLLCFIDNSISISESYKNIFTQNYLFGVLIILFAAIALFVVRLFFYKTNSIEVFFFMLFIASMIFESSRSFIVLLESENLSSVYLLFLSRGAFFGKIFGTFALFAAALASTDIGIAKLDTPIIIIIIASFLFASGIPFSDNILDNGCYRPGFFNYFLFTLLFIEFLTVLIFVINFLQKKNNEYFYMALATMLVIAGKELTFYSGSFEYFIPGIILMIAGTVLYSNKLHEIYKWY